jgi:hypothetical protein
MQSANLIAWNLRNNIFAAFLIHFLFWLLDATIYVGGLDEKVTETLLWELFVQAGPVGEQM